MAKKVMRGEPELAAADPEGIMRAALAGAMPATRESRDLLMPWAISLGDGASPAAAAKILLAADATAKIVADPDLPGDEAWRAAVRDLLREVARHDQAQLAPGQRRGGRRRRAERGN
ncbi:MAG: hypothetical protein RIE31_07845 [Alphaproteobacteria bacterium]